MTAGGLPTFKKIGKRAGAGKDIVRSFEILSPLETEGADLLSELTTPPEVKIPPTPAPAPTPTSLDESVLQKERARRRQRINAAGRQGTILTGGSVLGGTSSSRLGG